MSSPLPSYDAASARVDEYTMFIEQVLRPELKQAQHRVQEVQEEIQEYQALKETLQQQQQQSTDENNGNSTTKHQVVDLGHQSVYCPAVIRKDASVFVDVGFGIHAEMMPDQAMAFCDQRVAFVTSNRLQYHQQQLVQVQDHFQSSLNILTELEQLQQQQQKLQNQQGQPELPP